MVSPERLVPGRDQLVSCTAHNVWPAGPDSLSFALLLGEQRLEGARALEPEQEEETQEEETQEAEGTPLFRVTQHWVLPALGSPAPPALSCQVTMRLPKLVLTHRREIPGETTGSYLPRGSALGPVIGASLPLRSPTKLLNV